MFRADGHQDAGRGNGHKVLRAVAPVLSVAAFALAAAACDSAAAATHGALHPTATTRPTPTTQLTPTTQPTQPTQPTTVTTPHPPAPASLSTAVDNAAQVGSKPYKVTCGYPVLSVPADPAAATSVDSVILGKVTSSVSAFENYVNGGSGKPGAYPDPATLTCTWSKSVFEADLGSVDLIVTTFPEGAAHPIAITSTFNFDPATGQELTLQDLFRPGSDWLQVLSDESAQLVPAALQSESFGPPFTSGYGPVAANFAAWQVSLTGLTIDFQEYQVAPYAWGSPTIHIPFSALSSIANPAGPLAAAPIGS